MKQVLKNMTESEFNLSFILDLKDTRFALLSRDKTDLAHNSQNLGEKVDR